MPDEAQPGHHRQRGPGHQQGACGIDHGEGRLHLRRRHGLAEEDDVGLEDPTADRAVGDHEVIGLGQDGVRVRGDLDVAEFGDPLQETRVQLQQQDVQLIAGEGVAAVQTANQLIVAVQVDHVLRAGPLVQPIDILSDHPGHDPGRLHAGQRIVALVRFGRMHLMPAQVVARPVVAAKVGAGDELGVGDRVTRLGVGAAVVREPRVGGEPGAGQRGDPASGQSSDGRVQLGLAGRGTGVRLTGQPANARHQASVASAPARRRDRCTRISTTMGITETTTIRISAISRLSRTIGRSPRK